MPLLDRVFEYYSQSRDFNGYPISNGLEVEKSEREQIRTLLEEMIRNDEIVLRFGEYGNPFIKGLPDISIDEQVELLHQSDLNLIVLYPSNRILGERIDVDEYAGRPFSLRLALGEAQLDFHSFDLSVLEFYRNDPRYYYRVDDIHGTIYIRDEVIEEATIPDKDKANLTTFGFSYDDEMRRSVAVFTRYLHDLSPEHQQIWEAKRLTEKNKLHPDYYRTSIQGMFPEHIPILSAFLMELSHINEMCALMGKPKLFINTPSTHERPSNFGFLIRPTSKEFYDFVLLLDQLMSDNINKKFFKGEIDLEEDIKRGDGRIEVRQKGTIALLKEWISSNIKLIDEEPFDQMIEAFREVRKVRQTPAHKIVDNEFDQEFFTKQRDLILRSFNALRLIRLILKNHPTCVGYDVEDALYEGRIRTY